MCKSKNMKTQDISFMLIFTSQDLETTQVPKDKWESKELSDIHNVILLSCKKDEVLPFIAIFSGLEALRTDAEDIDNTVIIVRLFILYIKEMKYNFSLFCCFPYL